MDADRDRWDARYATAESASARPPDAAVDADLVGALPTSGRMLDVACGLGPVSLWGAAAGLDVTALDVSGVAIECLLTAASAEELDIDARRVDLDDGLPPDLGRFDLVVCQRFRDPAVLRSLPDLVVDDGWLIVTVLSVVGAESPGPFHAPPGELCDALPATDDGWLIRHRHEADGEASVILQRTSDGGDS